MKILDFDKNENEKPQKTRLGLSLNDYMDLLEEEMAPDIADKITLKDCRALEITTKRAFEGCAFRPEEEAEQHLILAGNGQVRLRTHTYNRGEGRYGIGRILEGQIEKAAMAEILNTLDSWLFTRSGRAWEKKADAGTWRIRVVYADGREAVQQGPLTGAFLADMDVSGFMRYRLPFDGLYLFDEYENA